MTTTSGMAVDAMVLVRDPGGTSSPALARAGARAGAIGVVDVATEADVAAAVAGFAAENGGIAILSDRGVHAEGAALPLILVVAAVNQRLIDDGLRLRVSLA